MEQVRAVVAGSVPEIGLVGYEVFASASGGLHRRNHVYVGNGNLLHLHTQGFQRGEGLLERFGDFTDHEFVEEILDYADLHPDD